MPGILRLLYGAHLRLPQAVPAMRQGHVLLPGTRPSQPAATAATATEPDGQVRLRGARDPVRILRRQGGRAVQDTGGVQPELPRDARATAAKAAVQPARQPAGGLPVPAAVCVLRCEGVRVPAQMPAVRQGQLLLPVLVGGVRDILFRGLDLDRIPFKRHAVLLPCFLAGACHQVPTAL